MSDKCKLSSNLSETSSSKKKKYQTRYSKECEKKYTFIRKCSSNVVDHEYKFHCNTCNTDLKCGTGGINDIDKHVNSPKHNKNANTIRS